MKVSCACGKSLELIGMPDNVTTVEDPMVIGAARRMGWKHAPPGIFFCGACAQESLTSTEPSPSLSPAEAAQEAVQRIEHGLDRLVLRGMLYDEEISDMRRSLSALYTFAQTEVERCRV
jgi:hypothetical protein